jgi:hypothetical protein
MAHINDVWGKLFENKLPMDNKFIVAYGNEYHGDEWTKEELLKHYKLVLKRAFNTDISIYFNGKKIRSIINFNKKITDKQGYYQQVIKY